jgi:uncharacterized membrane protein YbaN (DUF454 family)
MEIMIKNTKRAVIVLVAFLFLVVGIAGIVLPVIPGLVFIAVSIILFSLFFPAIGEKTRRHTRKYPKLHQAIIDIEERVRRIVGEL